MQLTGTSIYESLIGSTDADWINANSYSNDGISVHNDTLIGGLGNNTLVVDGDKNWLDGSKGNDSLYAVNNSWPSYGDNTLIGGGGNDTMLVSFFQGNSFVDGGDGNDSLDGGVGSSTMLGGAGNDSIFGGSGNESFAGVNYIDGGDGNDSLDGGSDSDTLLGGAGNDYLFGGANNDGAWGGFDSEDFIDGGDGNDTLRGSSSEVFNDNCPAATLLGGGGDDLFLIYNVKRDTSPDRNMMVLNFNGDVIIENEGGGIDTIRLFEVPTGVGITYADWGEPSYFEYNLPYTLPENVENLELWMDGDAGAIGNSLANKITGNSAKNIIHSREGDDSLIGGGGNDELFGEQGCDTLLGGEGDDILDGGSGVDSLVGSVGNDTYYVNGMGDIVVEDAGEGFDQVNSSVSYTLGANLENLVLTGTDAINATGNSLANTVSGNDAANRINGGAGNDTIAAGGGNDTLIGGTGNDNLNGGKGIDSLIGGAGDDTYYVDDLSDETYEVAGGGSNDRVFTSISGYTLRNEVEILILNDGIVSGKGNGLNNSLIGNANGNSLDGGAGNDTLVGGAGNDTYFVDSTADVVVEGAGQGTDLVIAAVDGYKLGDPFENLLLAGGIRSGVGNALDNTITGNAAANVLDGGAGTDSLVGGAGDDTYIINDKSDRVFEIASGGYDLVQTTISNFTFPDYVEVLQLLGSAAISAKGNSVANKIIGNTAANTLLGGGGNDTLLGDGGNDTLGVGAGVASVNGGAGSDLLKIDWSSISGGMLSRSIQRVGTGTDVTYKGSYAVKDITGKVLSQVNFDSIEQLSLNGVPINLAEASTPGVVANRLSTTAKTSETGDKVDFSVALNVAPKGNVTLRFQSSDLTEGKALNPELTFTPSNWDRPQKLTVQGVDDFENDGNISYTVSGKVVTSDLTYIRISVPSFSLTNQDDTVDAPLTFDGTKGVDYFHGNNGDDRIYGDNGQDQLKGGPGNDRIYGENDNDRIYGELGNDELYGGYDDDTIDGGDGGDSLFGEQGRDTLLGGSGNDYLDGGLLNDSMVGGAGNDTYLVDNAGDIINDLGAATDVDTVLVIHTISFVLPANVENAAINASGNANLTGNALNNGLTGNDAKNTLDGGVGNDTLDGGAGPDKLIGGSGNDEMIGGSGNDTFLGGDGVDLADYAAAGLDVNIDLVAGKASGDGTDLLFDIENVLSGEGNDTLTGSSASNDLEGGTGTDSLNGGAGNDTMAGCFYGANGGQYEIDTLTGGAGADLFQLGWSGGCFYNDGSASNAGRSDYAIITDFTVGTDRLQLDGVASNYYLGASGVSGVSGQGLWLEQGTTDELIAIIRSSNATTFTADNLIKTASFV